MKKVIFEGSAPGRMDVMGGIADYSGSLVLQMPIRQRTEVKLGLRSDGICNVTSRNSSGPDLIFTVRLGDLLDSTATYERANQYFKTHPAQSWAGYVVGCALVLMKEKRIPFEGADIEIFSDVPLGKGVSSSASLEVATMKALAKAFDIDFQHTDLPILAQKVENLVVGAPCGLMDQLATYFGKNDQLLPIICQPDKILRPINIPSPLKFVGIDSGVRHSVGGASYSDVRCAAFMGYTMIARHLGASDDLLAKARVRGDRSGIPYGGYLCNISIKEFEERFRAILPNQIRGSEFIKEHKTTIDPVTRVKPDSTYNVLACTSHPVYENARVHEFKDLLQNQPTSAEDQRRLGALMFAAHESYSNCGLGSDRTDEIVDEAKKYLNDGILGAKITGGGSGGTVCLLVNGPSGLQRAKEIHQAISRKYNQQLVFFE